MPRNETIIAVPVVLDTHGQVRQFLVRLVEQLDIVLGNRGGDPYVSASALLKTQTGVTALEKQITSIVESVLSSDSSTSGLIESILEETTAQIEALKSSSTITDANTTLNTFSGPPTKAEVEALDAKVVANAGHFNSLLTALRDTGIIAT